MAEDHSASATFKQKVSHELKEMLGIFGYFAFLLCAMAIYTTLLLEEFHVSYFMFGAAFVNALILSKVIMLGDLLHVGTWLHGRPVIITATAKAVLFTLLMGAFHIAEEIINHLIHGHSAADAVRELADRGLTVALARNLVFFGSLVPFFLCRELGRCAGETSFFHLLIRPSVRTEVKRDARN